jgi:hypothetical protein
MQNRTTEATDNGGKRPERILSGPGIEAGRGVFARFRIGSDVDNPFHFRPLHAEDREIMAVNHGPGRRFGLKIAILPGVPFGAHDPLCPGLDLSEHLRRQRDGEGSHGVTAFRGLPPFFPFSREAADLRSDFTRPIAAAATEMLISIATFPPLPNDFMEVGKSVRPWQTPQVISFLITAQLLTADWFRVICFPHFVHVIMSMISASLDFNEPAENPNLPFCVGLKNPRVFSDTDPLQIFFVCPVVSRDLHFPCLLFCFGFVSLLAIIYNLSFGLSSIILQHNALKSLNMKKYIQNRTYVLRKRR